MSTTGTVAVPSPQNPGDRLGSVNGVQPDLAGRAGAASPGSAAEPMEGPGAGRLTDVWSAARPTPSWSGGPRPAAGSAAANGGSASAGTGSPAAAHQGDTSPESHPVTPYPDALYNWARAHGAYFGTDDPIGSPASTSTGRTVALIIGALVAATGIAAGLVVGLGHDPGSAAAASGHHATVLVSDAANSGGSTGT